MADLEKKQNNPDFNQEFRRSRRGIISFLNNNRRALSALIVFIIMC